MAEIEMERKPRSNTWLWVAAALLVLVIAVGAYLLYERGATGYESAPAAEQTGVTQPYDARPAPDQPYVEQPYGTRGDTLDPMRTPAGTTGP
jgi:hypothetical protein